MKYMGIKVAAVCTAVGMMFSSLSMEVLATEETTQATVEQTQSTSENMPIESNETTQETNIADTCYMQTMSTSTTHYNTMNYWMYRPTASTEETLPLIIYLHGKDGCGSNIQKVVEIEGLPQFLYNGTLTPNAVVIAPQIPVGKTWTNSVKDVMDLIETVIAEQNIDRARIALTGASLGGIGTFNVAIAYPDFFSCIVPVCANVNASKTNVLTDMPVWIFHGTKDTGMGFSVRDAETVINQNGGNAKLTWLEGYGHEIRFIYAEQEYDVVNWMISQKRADGEDINDDGSLANMTVAAQ